ncbi:T9SS type B sorting domain-containing protein [Flavobacteriaceae bacterium XHP0103]|uniref:choice-of-anchor L domain-containing protein n=1 Tax=Marixanthotalea marina TaxID=2844359 RepID=UPI002989C75B|nr:choice-of-anchor L domain-containing protein [Marixanthotalea marina]MBU3822422.1 T9SS type B sorting domain-containing protein [Marixanthotalea marina]
MTKNLYLILVIFFCSVSIAFAQKITVTNPGNLEDLILDNLINGCVEVSNITTSVNGNVDNLSSYAGFTSGSSNFPFASGIMLSTGNALSAGNSDIAQTLSEGTTAWGTDSDLETALGVSNTLNATSIEFDIISTSGQLRFNYLLASEEYEGVNSCQFSDGFAFLIKETGSPDPYQNIAVIPNTSTPVNTGTIHPQLGPNCPAVNEQYFGGYNIGDTNFEGRTTVLTASTTITPYVQYHIKLVIADQSDQTFDSAVFIEGDSFDILDLGDDIATCSSSVSLDANINNPSATYQWFLNNNLIAGETNVTLNAVQSGTYRVEVTVPLGTGNCVEEDEINIVLDTEENINPISNYQLCDDLSGDGVETFDLSFKNAEVVSNIPFANYTFSYHLTDTEARNNTNEITSPIQNTSSPQTIFVRIEDTDTGCLGFTSFDLIVNPAPIITNPTPLDACDSDGTPDGYSLIDLTQKDDEITGGDSNLVVTYHYNAPDATSGNNPITNYTNANTPNDTVYVRVFNTQTGCYNTTSLDINMEVSPIVNTDTQYIDACDRDLDGFDTFDLTEVLDDILNGLTGVTPTFHETYDDAESGSNPIANATNYANIQQNLQEVYVRVEDDNTGCYTIVPVQIHSNLLLTGTGIQDYALCNTEDSGGTIEFDLYIVESYIANDLPNVTVTFFETEADRDNNVNPINKAVGYPVSATNPSTVYLRIGNGECEEIAEIQLRVNPILLFTPTAPFMYCDSDDNVEDGTTSVDLSSYDEIINNGNTDFSVSYFPTEADAENNFNQLPLFHSVSGTETIFVRIENIVTGCATTSSFEIEIIQAPDAVSPSPITICDNDQDGLTTIDLNDISDDVISNPSQFTINYHTSIDEAETNTNAIPNSDWSNYNTATQTLYARVENSNCYKIVPVDIIVNTLPIITNIDIMQLCEDDNDQTATFFFSDKDAEILNGQPGKEVFYFENETDALNGNTGNAIDKYAPYSNLSSPQTIYVRVENVTDPNCYATDSFTISVSSNPIYNTAFEDFFQCDDASNDERHTFDLNEKITEIKQGTPNPDDLNVSFHLNFNDAQNNIGPLPLQYTNATNPQTLYVRIESIDTQCVVVDELGINIIPAPNLTDANPLMVCDNDSNRFDGITEFNLDDADYQNLDRIQIGVVVHYYENFEDINQDDALDNSLAISNPNNYVSNTKTVYIKVTNTITECFTVIPLELVVESPPSPNNIGTIEICDNDTDTYDLLQVNSMLLDNPDSATISYHNSQADADNDTAAIGNTFNYTSNNHIIFVRLENPNFNCYITTTFTLQINPNPIANTPPDLISCDDDYDGIYEFDLSQNTNSIIGANLGNYTVTYHATLVDAETGSNSLNNLYPSTDGEIIFARLENTNTGCFDTTQFTLFVNPLPVIPVDDVIPLCVNDLPLIIDAETSNPNDTYLWSTGETTPQITLGQGDIGDYWVTVTRTYPNAPSCEFTKSFSVIESAIADINFTTTVNFADPNSITVDVSGIGDYVFILDGGEPQTSNVFNNVSIGPHTVTVRDLNGCADISQDVTVFDIPKFVTPNNDGYFDRWHVAGIEQLPGTIVYIYDRYGKLLKTLPHTSLGWDGTYNGHNMPADDYWFVANIEQEGNAFTIKGHFALKR